MPAREDDWMDCDPSEIGSNCYQSETYHIGRTKRKLRTSRNLRSPHSSSWKDHRTPHFKTTTEQFKYTDVHGNDLWACVKTVYASKDSYEVYIADGNGAWHHVKLLQDKRHVSKIREPYSDVTKYWRDHYVPSYSMERSKPCVLRDSFVPSYSRLSARAQAWRGFIKPKLSLMERISPPRRRDKYVPRYSSRHGNHRADSHTSRSFNKYRNRHRHHFLNDRIKINLATIVPSSTAELDDMQLLVAQPATDQEKLRKKLYTVIIENLPEDTQESDAMALVSGWGNILAIQALPISISEGVFLIVTDCATVASSLVQALHCVIFGGSTIRCSHFSKLRQEQLQQVVKSYAAKSQAKQAW